MKVMKMFKTIIIVAALMCGAMMLSACSGDKTYKVTVKDALGDIYESGIVVQFMQDGTQVAMQTCKEGVAEKELPKGDYTVNLMFVDGEDGFYYEKEDLKLTAKNTELEVIVAYAINTEPTTVVKDNKTYDAYSLSKGCTYVTLSGEDRNYFLFTPTEAGTYEFSIKNAGDAAIGYYGAPHYIQDNSAAEVVDNKFTVSVSASMISSEGGGTSVYVIGVDANSAKSGVICIDRIGDAQKTVADEPWTVYEKTVELEKYTAPAGASVEEFDITAATDKYNLVFNESDGFYHLNAADGPLVLVRLAEKSQYLDSYKTITSKTGVVKYFYDDNGEFVKKETYTDCLLEYIECVDEKLGVYPLTKDLEYIIKNHGEHQGWYEKDGDGLYLFVDRDGQNVPGINPEISWLFMCCYLSE